jgi:hypothetical protein
MSTVHGSAGQESGERQQDERRQEDEGREQQGQEQQQPQGQAQEQSQQQEQGRQREGEGEEQGAMAPARRDEEAGHPEQKGEQPQRRAESGEVLARPMMTSGDDVAFEAPHMSVDELNLELQGGAGIEHVTLHAKAVDLEMYLRANLDNLAGGIQARDARARRISQVTHQGSEQQGSGRQGRQGEQQGEEDQPAIAGELQQALDSARSAYEHAAPELREELHEAYDAFRDKVEHVVGDGGESRGEDGGQAAEQHDGGGALHMAGERAKRFARSPGAAAVAGAAGAAAALAGSKARLPARKHNILDHLPGRRPFLTDRALDHLPGKRPSLAGRAAHVPGEIAHMVRDRLG